MSNPLGPDSTPQEISRALPNMSDDEIRELYRALERRMNAVGVYNDDSVSEFEKLARVFVSTPDAERLKESCDLVGSELVRRSQERPLIEFVPDTAAVAPRLEPRAEPPEGFVFDDDPISPMPPIDSDYDAGHNFGWKARSKKTLVIGGGVLLVGLLLVVFAVSGVFSGSSGTKTATTDVVSSSPPSEGSQTTAVTTATTVAAPPQSTSSTPASAPLVSAAIAGIGRAGQHSGNDVWDVVTCNIRAWEGAQIKGTVSGSAVGSTVSFDALAGQVDVYNPSTHPNPSAATINPQYTLVELVFAGQVSGSVTCAIDSVSAPPAGSTLSTDTSLWTMTNSF